MRKTVSFAAIHFTIAFTLGWVMTGSVLVGGALALLEPTLNTVAFHWHEKWWARKSQTCSPLARAFPP